MKKQMTVLSGLFLSAFFSMQVNAADLQPAGKMLFTNNSEVDLLTNKSPYVIQFTNTKGSFCACSEEGRVAIPKGASSEIDYLKCGSESVDSIYYSWVGSDGLSRGKLCPIEPIALPLPADKHISIKLYNADECGMTIEGR